MGRIRLQICVLPWELPRPSPSHSGQARQETVKWCEPCTEDTHMQEVCDRIFSSWHRIFEPSMGPLNIRHLKTSYGDFVDLQERVVGDLFDDRGADGNIRNSILEVHRYPPSQEELGTLQRFSSLAPNSSARPRKRPLETAPHSHFSQTSGYVHRAIPSVEEEDVETERPFGMAAKRRRTDDERLNTRIAADQSLEMRKEHGGGPYHSSQTFGTQESVHQVPDSQKSPGKKRSNPYGTPTSLALIGSQDSFPVNEIDHEIDLSGVPDSPLGREAIPVDRALEEAPRHGRASTKSESPELSPSVQELPPTHPVDASSEQPTNIATSPKPSTAPFIFTSASQPTSIVQIVDGYAKKHGLSVGQIGRNASDVNRSPKRRSPMADSPHPQMARNNGIIVHDSDPIFDPIESDTESFNEKQQMQSAKRLRSSKEPTAISISPRASNQTGVDRREGMFLVPSAPQQSANGVCIPLGQANAPRQLENIQKPKQDLNAASMNAQDEVHQQSKHDAEFPEYAQSESFNNEPNRMLHEISSRDIGCDDPTSTAKTSSQATTVWSQDSAKSINGTGITVNKEKQVEEEEFAQMAVEKESAGKQESAKRKAIDEGNADNKGPEEQKARLEELAQAKKAKAQEEELAEAKRAKEARLNAARLADEKKTSERLAREQQTRETALAEEAKKMMLAADGARSLDAEKKEKEKARRREMEAKKKANDAKAAEQERETQGKDSEKKAREERLAREQNRRLANVESRNAQKPAQAESAKGPATALKEDGQKNLADRDVQKLRNASELQGRSSTTPSDIAGRNRSLTPFVPGPPANKSSHQNSVVSSPISNHSSGAMNAPLRSALRQTPSSLPRSVSSVSFDVPPRAKINEYNPSTAISKSLKENDNDLAPKDSSATHIAKNKPRVSSNLPSKTPIHIPLPKTASTSKVSKTPAKNGKVQTKLNVTVQRKKLKGRVVGPPIASIPAPKQAIVLSSGEDSSTSEEEPVWQTGNAKAGPSSRKPIIPVTTSHGKKTAGVKRPGTNIDPIIRNIKVEKDTTAAPAALPRSTPNSETTSLQKSNTRSPVQALSQSILLSSGSASSSDSDSTDSTSTSDSEEKPTDVTNGKVVPRTVEEPSNASNLGIKQSQGYIQNKVPSQPSRTSSSGSRNAISVHSDGKPNDETTIKKVPLESRQSVSRSGIKQTPSTTSRVPDDKVINQGLNRAGRLPNGIRPAYFQYPTLTELEKLDRSITPPTMEKRSSQVGKSPSSESDDSSSDSDESSSDSISDDDVGKVPNQNSSQKSILEYSGVRGLMKLAKSIPVFSK